MLMARHRCTVGGVLVALAAWGAAWVTDQPGEVALSFGGSNKYIVSLSVFALMFGIVLVAAMMALGVLGVLWWIPGRVRRGARQRRIMRGRQAITHGLLAIGHGDATAARRHADEARRLASHDPLALLLHAQSAQLDGDRDGAKAVFSSMAEREDTRLLGLRGDRTHHLHLGQ